MQSKSMLQQSFVLRMWFERVIVDGKPAFAWRCVLLDLHQDRRIGFHSYEALVAYLQAHVHTQQQSLDETDD
jgi:hypothetical protein